MRGRHIMSVKGKGVLAASLLSLTLGLAACSSVPLPSEQLQTAGQAVSKLDQANIPLDAQVNVSNARDKLAAAKEAVTAKDYLKARNLAEQSQADAELALAKSDSAKTKAAVEELRQSISALQSEISRSKGVR